MEQTSRNSSLLETHLDRIGIHLDADQREKFMVYLHQLQVWNRSVNLTGITDDQEIVIKHFLDSLSVLTSEQMRQGASLVDIGTGAGFPGVPLKIARRDLQVTLVEPVQKKISFLYYIVGLLRLQDVHIFYGTFDQFLGMKKTDDVYDYITTRALKYDVVLRGGSRLLGRGGRAIIYSSQPICSEELKGWCFVNQWEFDLPGKFGHRAISVLEALN